MWCVAVIKERCREMLAIQLFFLSMLLLVLFLQHLLLLCLSAGVGASHEASIKSGSMQSMHIIQEQAYHMQQVYRVEQEYHTEDCTQPPAADMSPAPVWLLAQQFGVTL